MKSTKIETGDRVKTKKPIRTERIGTIPCGCIGSVFKLPGQRERRPKFLIRFEACPPVPVEVDDVELVAKYRPVPTIHPQKAINLGGEMVEVDIKLAPLIQGLFRAGILTSMSCQENQPGIIWLHFVNTEHALRFVSVASKVVESFIWTNHGVLIDPGDDIDAVSIRFPLAGLPKLKRLFPAR